MQDRLLAAFGVCIASGRALYGFRYRIWVAVRGTRSCTVGQQSVLCVHRLRKGIKETGRVRRMSLDRRRSNRLELNPLTVREMAASSTSHPEVTLGFR